MCAVRSNGPATAMTASSLDAERDWRGRLAYTAEASAEAPMELGDIAWSTQGVLAALDDVQGVLPCYRYNDFKFNNVSPCGA